MHCNEIHNKNQLPALSFTPKFRLIIDTQFYTLLNANILYFIIKISYFQINWDK